MLERSRGIIIFNNKVLVIRITKKDKKFFTLPGGHSKKGEDIREVCKREIEEETGLKVEVKDEFFKTKESNHITRYFLCQIEDAESFAIDENGLPIIELKGEELRRKEKYEAVWLAVKELKEVNFYPRNLVDMLVNSVDV